MTSQRNEPVLIWERVMPDDPSIPWLREQGFDVRLGGAELKGVTVAIMDLSPISQALGRRTPVLLGKEMMNQAITDIDFAARRIRLVAPEAFAPPPGAVDLPLTPVKGLRALPVVIEGGPTVMAMFDLGNGSPLALFPGYAAEARVLEGRRASAVMAGGVGGAAPSALFNLNRLSIGGHVFENVPTTLRPADGVWAREDAAANVGLPIFSRFRLMIDFGGDRLFLLPGPDMAKPLPRDRSGLTTAVLFVDLDNFKTLNDTRGHEVGDLLLKAVAQRLRGCVRGQDTVARLGGDEFVVVLQGLSSSAGEAATQARTLGELIMAQLRQPSELDGHEHHFSASIGVALVRDHRDAVDEVLKQADLAMYRAKDAGRNTLRFFDPDMQQAVNRRAQLETELHSGLRQAQFHLLYQPQVDSQGRITGAEALVRWQHPARGQVSPAEFIPLAEESGLILPLGHWVMETALRQQARWRQDPALAPLSLAINVSARQFLQDDFVAQVLELLRRTGAHPAQIKLELTESLLLRNVESAITTMHALRSNGLGLSLDDFGTGYSSLSYLKRLPLDQIKIDQAFVRDALHTPRDAAIARAIIALADSLGLDVVAEGVETAEHHQFLLTHGCRAFQGYLFGRPLALEAFEQLARR